MPTKMQHKNPDEVYDFPLRRIPGDVLNDLSDLAEAEKRTVNDQIVTMLERTVRRKRRAA